MTIQINGTNVETTHTLTYKANPKRPGFKAHARYEAYSKAETVGEYLELADKKYAKADLRYDEENGYIEIHDQDGTLVNQSRFETE